MSDSAPPPHCGFETWFDPSPASSSSRPRYRVYPRVVVVVSEVAARAAALHRRSQPLSAILPSKIRRYTVADQPLFCGSAAGPPVVLSFSGHCGRGVYALGLRNFCGDRTLGEVIPVSARGDVFVPLVLAMLKRHCFNPSTPGLFNTAIASVSASLAFSGACGGVGVDVPSLYASGVSPAAFVGPDSGAAETHAHSHPGFVTGLFVEPLLNSVAAQVTEASFVSSSLAVSKALFSRSGSEPLATSSLPLAGPSGYRPIWRCGRGSALRPPRSLVAASASRVVRGRLLLRNLRVFGSGSHRLP